MRQFHYASGPMSGAAGYASSTQPLPDKTTLKAVRVTVNTAIATQPGYGPVYVMLSLQVKNGDVVEMHHLAQGWVRNDGRGQDVVSWDGDVPTPTLVPGVSFLVVTLQNPSTSGFAGEWFLTWGYEDGK